jgi:fumarylpyruvate hydrolase
MAHVIALWTPPSLPVAGGGDTYPVRRIFCVGRNYAEY